MAREEGAWLGAGVEAAMVGFAAPNMRAMREKGADTRSELLRRRCREAMQARCEKALAAFEALGCRDAVLGAVGCGVFEADPADAALAWRESLLRRGGSIQRIEFALGPSPSREILTAFAGLERAGEPAGAALKAKRR